VKDYQITDKEPRGAARLRGLYSELHALQARTEKSNVGKIRPDLPHGWKEIE